MTQTLRFRVIQERNSEISSKELRCYESGGFTKKPCLVIRLPHEIVDVHYTLIKIPYS